MRLHSRGTHRVARMTKSKLIVVGIVIVVVAIGISSWYGFKAYSRACTGIQKLAVINHTLVGSQLAQTRALVKKGFTFGIPKKELPLLVKHNEEVQIQFLAELDELANSNCSTI